MPNWVQNDIYLYGEEKDIKKVLELIKSDKSEFDFNKIVTPSEVDGLHYTKESHQIIAQHLSEFVKTIAVLPKIL